MATTEPLVPLALTTMLTTLNLIRMEQITLGCDLSGSIDYGLTPAASRKQSGARASLAMSARISIGMSILFENNKMILVCMHWVSSMRPTAP